MPERTKGRQETLACRLCGSPGCRPLFSRADHRYLAIRRRYTCYGCRRCGVRFLPERDLRGLPDDIYLHEKERTAAGEVRRHVHWDADVIRALAERVPRGRLLDFGSGYGDMLIAAREAGYQPEGLDISPVFAREAEARSGCPVFVGPLERAAYPAGRFQAINSHCVLLYAPDPVGTLREMARVLAPGGLVRVFEYTWDSLPARLRGSEWWYYAPTHPFSFSRRTFAFLAREAGLRLERVVYGGEQTLASYRAERRRRTPFTDGVDAVHYRLARAWRWPLPLCSGHAFYLRK